MTCLDVTILAYRYCILNHQENEPQIQELVLPGLLCIQEHEADQTISGRLALQALYSL